MEAKEEKVDLTRPGRVSNPLFKNIRWSDSLVVLAFAWAARLAFICLVPARALSFDAFSWEREASLLNNGINPYHADTLFNWPPLWMQIVYVISKISGVLSVSFFLVLQIFLVVVESVVIVQVVGLIREIAPAADVRKIVIIGLSLNPIAILLVCQHCNFDVLMVLWLLLFVRSLLRYNSSNNPVDWLCACLFLGLGILTKTVPLVFIPLLAGGFSKASSQERLLGLALVMGPVTLGMSIIYVLAPLDVLHHVLDYRAIGVFFGIPGFLHLLGADNYRVISDAAFYVLGLGIMVLTWRYFWRNHSVGNQETVLYVAIVLAAIPGLGPGFGGQYFYWFLPFLVATYAAYSGLWRWVLIGFGLISVGTFIIEYGLISAYGALFPSVEFIGSKLYIETMRWADRIDSPTGNTLERIPLFIAFITLIVLGTLILLRNIRGLRKTWVLGLLGLYSLSIIVVLGMGLVKYFL